MNQNFRKEYLAGMQASIPVCVGYFAVSFGFGALAVSRGVASYLATLISLCNLTSAGQLAGLTVIANLEPLVNMFLTQLVINSRYALMSISLGQRMESIPLRARFFISFHVTDEIFAIAMGRPQPLTTPYLLGLGILPILGWTGGTFAGAFFGSVLPAMVQNSLCIALYAMFIAVVVPDLGKKKPLFFTVGLASGISCLFYFVPILPEKFSGGLSIVIATVVSAALSAWLFPMRDEEVTA